MTIALQVIVSGLAAGGVYGLFAAGHSLVYRLTGVVHFALGYLVGLAVFVTLLVASGTGPVTQTSVGGGRFALALLVGFVVCAAAGVGTYVLAVQPYLARGSTIGWVAATLAIGFAVRAALQAAFGRPAYVFPDPLPFRMENGDVVSQNVHPLIDTSGAANAAAGLTVAEVRTEFVDLSAMWKARAIASEACSG